MTQTRLSLVNNKMRDETEKNKTKKTKNTERNVQHSSNTFGKMLSNSLAGHLSQRKT